MMTPELMNHVRPIYPVSTWHLFSEKEVVFYFISSFPNANRNSDQPKQYCFPTPEIPEDEESHTPIQERIRRDLQNLQETENLNPQIDGESQRNFLSNFDWKDSRLQQDETEQTEAFLVDFLARHRFDFGMNLEFTVKLTPKYELPANSQSLPTPVNLNEDILVELALLQLYGIITILPFSKNASPIFAQRKPTGKLRLLVNLRKIDNFISDDYINNNHPVSTLTDAAQHIDGKFFCQLDCSQAYQCLQMADQRCIDMLAFNFASRTFAYRRLTQGLSRGLSAYSSFMMEYLDRVIKADQCAQNVDDTGIAANDADHLIGNLGATFDCIREAGLKRTMHKCHFGASEIDS